MTLFKTGIVLACAGASLLFGGIANAYGLTPSEGSMSYDGTCARFEGKWTVFACAPSFAPDGVEILDLFEDGSASYPGWTYDPDTKGFTRS